MQKLLPAQKRLAFFNHVYEMVSAGVTVFDAVRNFDTRDKALKEAVRKVRTGLASGFGFCDALQRTGLADNLAMSVLRSGERSGLIEDALGEIKKFLEKSVQLQKEVFSALASPCFNILAAMCASFYMSMSVMPKVAGSLRSLGDLPALSETIFDVADKMAANWQLIIGAMALSLVACGVAFYRKPPFLYRMPVIGDVLKYQFLSMLFNALAVSHRAGSPTIDCLVETRKALTGYTRDRMTAIVRDMQRGAHIDMALGKDPVLFPRDIVSIVKTARMSGSYERLLGGIAAMCQDRGLKTAKRTASIINPIVIMLVGGLVAVMAISIYYPIATLNVGI